jgi:hypothetical protein
MLARARFLEDEDDDDDEDDYEAFSLFQPGG